MKGNSLMFKLIKSLSEKDVERQLNNFSKTHYIMNVQYSTSPYNAGFYHKVWFSALVEYKEYTPSK